MERSLANKEMRNSRGEDPTSVNNLRDSRQVELQAGVSELKQALIEQQRASHREIETLKESAARRESTLLWEVAGWKEAFRGVVESRSWKLTAPVRFIGAMCRSVTRGARRWFRISGTQSDSGDAGAPRSDDPLGSLQSLSRRNEVLEQTLAEIFAYTGDNSRGGSYVHRVSDSVDGSRLDVKALAFYVSNFSGTARPMELDGTRVGGWDDVVKARARYRGHYQPHLPGELGFYDASTPGLLRVQVEIAKQYGIYGFCFRCDWRHQQSPLNSQLNQYLEDKSLGLKFCICLDGSLSIPADRGFGPDESTAADEMTLLASLAPAFADPRYITVKGKPLLIVLGKGDMDTLILRLRDLATSAGIAEFYLVRMGLAGGSPAQAYDAVLGDPLCTDAKEITADCTLIDRRFHGCVYSYSDLAERQSSSVIPEDPQPVVFENVITSWDTETVHPGKGSSFLGASVAAYARWLNKTCRLAMTRKPDIRFVFITAWNDWMHGAHLEPDQRFGYAYLHATSNVLRHFHRDPATDKLIDEINSRFVPRSDTAVIFHCHYKDLIRPIFDQYISNATGADLFVTVPPDISSQAIHEMRAWFPHIYILKLDNRGRDIRPFLFALRHIRALGYRIGCKVHTKKTPQAAVGGGELWRQQLFEPLLGRSGSASIASGLFADDPNLGMLVPEGCIMDLGVHRNYVDNTFWLERLLGQIHRLDLVPDYNFGFPAGSMYWFRVQALDGLDDLVFPEDAFEIETGQRDGTLAHAIERLVILYAMQRGYTTREINVMSTERQSLRGAYQ